MTCISMSYDEKFNLCTCLSSASQCSFSAFWQAEIAISSQPQINQHVVCSTHFWIYLTYLTSITKLDLLPKSAPKEEIRYCLPSLGQTWFRKHKC
jgi:hypothetical protein